MSRTTSVLVTATLLAACGNQSGNISATGLGDLSQPADRGDPLVALRAACGADGATTRGADLHRDPYLQQVTSTSAMVGWVTTTPADDRIELTTPAGDKLATAAVEVDDSVPLPDGGHQAWAHLGGLAADTIYCYTLVDDGGAITERIGFRTAPAADTTRPIRFLAFGDSGGGGADQYALLDQMHTVPYEVMLHTGDLAYDHGTLAELENTVFGVYGDLLGHIPLFPAPGNHEYDTMDGAPFRSVFALPSNEEWYSFDWGPIHFAALDTEQSYQTQVAWLDADLASSQAPWKIVYLHKPPYSSGSKHGSDLDLRTLLEPVLVAHGVQLVLAGHDHDYERIEPQQGITYVVTGGGGVGTRPVSSSSFTAYSEAVIHFVYGEVYRDRMVLHAIDGAGKEFDSVEIPRTR